MTYEEIAAFLAVVKYGTMSQAAQQLNLSQSTVSSQIKSLENEFGVTLFKRGKGIKNVTLTQSGKGILDIAYKWESLWNETKNTLEKSSRKILQVAAVPSVNRYLMFHAISKYAQQYPEASFQIWNTPSEKCYAQVETNDVSAAFVTRPRYSAVVSSAPVLSERYQLIGGASCRFGKSVHPSELEIKKQVFMEWDSDFLQWHRTWWESEREAKISTNSVSFLAHMLKNSDDCWSIVPVSVARELLQSGHFKTARLKEGPGEHFVYILARDHLDLPKEIRDFLPVLRETTAKYDVRWLYEVEKKQNKR